MSDDIIEILAMCLMPLFLFSPIIAICLIFGIISYNRTKKWDQARKSQNGTELEANTLLTPDDAESDYFDTDDENEQKERKAEEERDTYLTFRQKWWKEFKNGWKNDKVRQAMKKKEREERRKLAKAVARELERERRRALRASGDAGDKEALPPYRKE